MDALFDAGDGMLYYQCRDDQYPQDRRGGQKCDSNELSALISSQDLTSVLGLKTELGTSSGKLKKPLICSMMRRSTAVLLMSVGTQAKSRHPLIWPKLNPRSSVALEHLVNCSCQDILKLNYHMDGESHWSHQPRIKQMIGMDF